MDELLGDKLCDRCGSMMTRKRYGKRLEDAGVFRKRRFCSLSCANKRGNWGSSSAARHRASQKFRRDYCEECGQKDHLHVHHVDENHHNNDPSNLKTLCPRCHKLAHMEVRNA